MEFSEIIDKCQSQATLQFAKDASFEKLMANFLRTYPVYERKFNRIWRWADFPYKGDIGGQELGVDLVAETEEGEFWAVQCKCYEASAYAPTLKKTLEIKLILD
jgi:predicted helicase